MGDEARCTVRYGERASDGRALLETDELLFRGDFRLSIPFRDIRSLDVENGRLFVDSVHGRAVFELGDRAHRWAERIRNPKTLLDKLALKAGARVALVGITEERFRGDVAKRAQSVAEGEPTHEVDVVFLCVESLDDLRALARLEERLARDGAIWVVAPKGGREPREADVLAAGKDAGLVDTKVVRFSETHTAHRFVIPVARR